MAKQTSAKRTQKASKKTDKNAKIIEARKHLSSFVAGFAGAAFGIALMLAVALPMMRNQLDSAVASLNQRAVAMTPTDSLTCPVPAGTSGNQSAGTAAVQTTGATTPMVAGGMGGGPTIPSAPSGNVITKLIGVYTTTNTGTISNTGAKSTNTISATTTNTTTVDNTNNVNITNNNSQTATSGNVTSTQNTTAGSTTSGTASNSSNTSYDVRIDN